VCVTFEVYTALIMKNAVFWDVTLYGSCKNRRFGGTYYLDNQSEKKLLVTANVVASSLILFPLMIEATSSSKRWILQEPHVVTFQKTTIPILHIPVCEDILKKIQLESGSRMGLSQGPSLADRTSSSTPPPSHPRRIR
jgi:hypothetical protein